MSTTIDERAAVAFQQAMALHQQGHLDEALAGYRRTLYLQPQNLLAMNLLGVISLQRIDPATAIEVFGKALLIDPQNAMLYVNRGSAYSMLNQHEAAIACYDKAIALDPDSNASPYYNRATSLQQLKRYEAAIASYDQAIALESDLDANAHYGRAMALFELKNYSGAIESLDKAIALGSSFAAEAYYCRGTAFIGLEHWDEALMSLDRAIALKSNYAEAFSSRGLVLKQLRNLDAAVESCERAIALSPNYAEALFIRGSVLFELKQPDAALQSLDLAVALIPDSAAISFIRGCVLCELRQWHAAVQSLDRVIALVPDHAEALSNRGAALGELRRWDAAVASCERALALKPNYTEAFFNLGTVLSEFNPEAALSSYRKALDSNPKFSKAYESLGSLLYRVDRNDQAIDVYRNWLKVEPDNPIAQHMYAAATGENVPQRADARYVCKMFDEFSGSFDSALQRVDYVVPQLLSAALAERMDFARERLLVLDAGCGTGLCGLPLRSTARTLTGVDLSPGMLAKAKAREIYDELVQGELCAFMASRPGEFDLVICADTFIYFGLLEEAITAARRCLRPNGTFAFSVETLPEGESIPFKLDHHGRYAHAGWYVRQNMGSAGFSGVEYKHVALRKERGKDVRGYLVIGSAPP